MYGQPVGGDLIRTIICRFSFNTIFVNWTISCRQADSHTFFNWLEFIKFANPNRKLMSLEQLYLGEYNCIMRRPLDTRRLVLLTPTWSFHRQSKHFHNEAFGIARSRVVPGSLPLVRRCQTVLLRWPSCAIDNRALYSGTFFHKQNVLFLSLPYFSLDPWA